MIGWDRCPNGTITGVFADHEIEHLRWGIRNFLIMANHRQREWLLLHPFGDELDLTITDGPSDCERYEALLHRWFEEDTPEPALRMYEPDFVRLGSQTMRTLQATLPKEQGHIWLRTPRQVRAWIDGLNVMFVDLRWCTYIYDLEYGLFTPTADGKRTVLEVRRDWLGWLACLADDLEELAATPQPTGDPRQSVR